MGNVTTRLKTVEILGLRTPKSACLESKLKDLEPHIRSTTLLNNTFVVHDLLKGYSYLVARAECHYQLTFMLKDGRQLIITVEPTGDTALVAQKIAERLTESGNGVLHLGLGPATEAYRRSLAWRRRQQLTFFGYSDAEITQLGDLSKLTNERMNELIRFNKLETTEKAGDEPNKTEVSILCNSS